MFPPTPPRPPPFYVVWQIIAQEVPDKVSSNTGLRKFVVPYVTSERIRNPEQVMAAIAYVQEPHQVDQVGDGTGYNLDDHKTRKSRYIVREAFEQACGVSHAVHIPTHEVSVTHYYKKLEGPLFSRLCNVPINILHNVRRILHCPSIDICAMAKLHRLFSILILLLPLCSPMITFPPLRSGDSGNADSHSARGG